MTFSINYTINELPHGWGNGDYITCRLDAPQEEGWENLRSETFTKELFDAL